MNIEPQEFINSVIKAYAKTKLVPSTRRMFRIKDGNKCACAMGVLYCEENGIPTHNPYNYVEDEIVNKEMWEWAKKKFGSDFVSSFWRGFDGTGKLVVDTDVYDLANKVREKVVTLYNKGELYG